MKLKSVELFESELGRIHKDFSSSFPGDLKEFSKDLFDRNPELENFGWTQYIPYFNDGDPCEFGLYEILYNDEIDSDNSLKKATCEEIKEFVRSLFKTKASEALEEHFGSYAKIKIDRNLEIEVSDFDQEG